MPVGSKGRKRIWEGEAEDDLEVTVNSTPVTLPSIQAIATPPSIAPLPPFQDVFSSHRKDGGDAAVGDGDRFLLFRIAKKFNMKWAVLGQNPSETGELGRPPTTLQPDRLLLSEGAAVDILSSVNSHLKIPSFNTIPTDFQSVVRSAARQSAPPLTSSGLNPIPMSRYSSEASEWASFLDYNPVVPMVRTCPAPAFPRAVEDARYSVRSHLEGITAMNILRDLPESAAEERLQVINHVASLQFSGLNRSSEALGSHLREVRQLHLAHVDPAIRDELVHQPIWSHWLYTDSSQLGTAVYSQPAPTGQFSYYPSLPSVVERAPAYSCVTPPLESYPTQDSQGGGLDLTIHNRNPTPSFSNYSRRDSRQSH